MLTIIVITLLAFLSRCNAAALAFDSWPSRSLKQKRQGPCTPESMQLDESFFDCPTTNHLDSNSNCLAPIPIRPNVGGCSAYCEVRQTMTYGQEEHIPDAVCSEADDCSVTKNHGWILTKTWGINVGITLGGKIPLPEESELSGALAFGASYEVSKSVTFSDTIGHTQKATPGICGYFTFIPFMITSCGTLTVAQKIPFLLGSCNKDNFVSVQNYCNTFPYINKDGQAEGQIILVRRDCKTGTVLDMDQQRPEYRYPGVSTARVKQGSGKQDPPL